MKHQLWPKNSRTRFLPVILNYWSNFNPNYIFCFFVFFSCVVFFFFFMIILTPKNDQIY